MSSVLRLCVNALTRVLNILLGTTMTVMLVSAIVQVVARYVLDLSLVWPPETGRYMMTGGTFIAIPVLAVNRGQIAVDAVMYYIGHPTARAILYRVILIIECLIVLVVTRISWQMTMNAYTSGQFSAGMHVPLAAPLAVVTIGCGIGAFVTALLLFLTFVEGRESWVPLWSVSYSDDSSPRLGGQEDAS